ncbi:MAG: VWA domain-containing protein [Pseudomonadota bacterium]
MLRKILPLTVALCCVTVAPVREAHAYSCARDAMLVFDGSASMAELGFDTAEPTRIDHARAAVAEALPQIASVRRVGLLIYGPGPEGSCAGINLKFRPLDDAAIPIIGAINGLDPIGLTPLTASVRAAAEVLQYRNKPGIVVLVTDGNETCGGSPCALAAELARTAQDLTVHVIGFRVVYDPAHWFTGGTPETADSPSIARCLADETGGLYVATETVEELAVALQETMGCALIGEAAPAPDKRRQPT